MVPCKLTREKSNQQSSINNKITSNIYKPQERKIINSLLYIIKSTVICINHEDQKSKDSHSTGTTVAPMCVEANSYLTGVGSANRKEFIQTTSLATPHACEAMEPHKKPTTATSLPVQFLGCIFLFPSNCLPNTYPDPHRQCSSHLQPRAGNHHREPWVVEMQRTAEEGVPMNSKQDLGNDNTESGNLKDLCL